MIYSEQDIEGMLDDQYFYSALVSVEWRPEDCGIGHYEFWGSHGYDSRIELKYETMFIEMLTIIDVTNDETILDNAVWTRDNSPTNEWMERVAGPIEDQLENMEAPYDLLY